MILHMYIVNNEDFSKFLILHNQPESIYLTCLCTFNHIFQEQGYQTFNRVMCRCIFFYGVPGVRNDYLGINKTMVTVFTLPATWWCQGCVRHSPGLPVHVPTSVNLHARDTPECSTLWCLGAGQQDNWRGYDWWMLLCCVSV